MLQQAGTLYPLTQAAGCGSASESAVTIRMKHCIVQKWSLWQLAAEMVVIEGSRVPAAPGQGLWKWKSPGAGWHWSVTAVGPQGQLQQAVRSEGEWASTLRARASSLGGSGRLIQKYAQSEAKGSARC